MNGSNHIIEKVFIEVNTSKLETAHALQNNIGKFLKEDFFPRLEVLFDAYNLNETVVRFDKIDLSITVAGQVDFNGIKHELSKKLENKLKLYLQPVLNDFQNIERKFGLPDAEGENKGIQIISGTENREVAFLFFLERGHLPWFAQENQINAFTEKDSWKKSLENPEFIEKIKTVLVQEQTAVDRFIYQFSEEIVLAFLMKINPKIERYRNQPDKLLPKRKATSNQLFLKLLLQLSVQTETNLTLKDLRFYCWQVVHEQELGSKKSAHTRFLELLQIIRDLLPDNRMHAIRVLEIDQIPGAENLKREEATAVFSNVDQNGEAEIVQKKNFIEEKQWLQQEQKTPFFEKANDEIAVQNAGLIILHPFLKHFFVKTGIANQQGTLPKENLNLAVQSLHFIATGNENVFEGNLVFEKFLCGLPLKMPIEKQSSLNDEIKIEVQVLLNEVIANWKALKNSSPNDLRQLFIQREGKLMQKENNYKLVVERKAQDVLLERISWNISMLKLPWRKELIMVEW